jgi:hypothetical protein
MHLPSRRNRHALSLSARLCARSNLTKPLAAGRVEIRGDSGEYLKPAFAGVSELILGGFYAGTNIPNIILPKIKINSTISVAILSFIHVFCF